MNRVKRLAALGQSIWLDYIRRDLLTSGALVRMVEDDGITGLTSNPTIFQKAIADTTLYDEALRGLDADGARDPAELYEAVAVEDVQAAADVFRGVYDRTSGADGFVSIEVSPLLAHDAEATCAEARRLFTRVGRPNVLIKVPGTVEGLAAIEELLRDGINVNVTLLFSIERYRQVLEAWLQGLERRMSARAKNLSGVASVASLFVSRVDTAVDKKLEELMAEASSEPERRKLASLSGTTAVANAKLAYDVARRTFAGARFRSLAAHGARPQRLLFGSTGTKNPRYRDVKYVEELVGPDTIDTVPPETLAAFRDHGRAARTVDRGLSRARATLKALASVGVDLGAITDHLEAAGVAAFADSHRAVLAAIAGKVRALRRDRPADERLVSFEAAALR